MPYEPQPGYTLVRAVVGFYQSLRPGEIGEIPTEVAERAIRTGMAEPVDSLDARLQRVPVAAASVKRWEDPDLENPPKTDLPAVEQPPKAGAGSGKAAWFEYAVARGLDPEEAEGMTRDDLIAAVEGMDGSAQPE